MAISLLDGSYDPEVVQFMHNNCFLFFKSDYVVAPPLKCVISVTNGTATEEVTIYANPQDEFSYNFKDLILAINSAKIKKYADDLVLTGLPYKNWNRILEDTSITLTIYFTNHTETVPSLETYTLNTIFINAVKQFHNKAFQVFESFNKDGLGVTLLPRPEFPKTGISTKLKYWNGYPFCISFYNKLQIDDIASPIILVSNLGSIYYENDITSRVTRLLLNTGNDPNLEDQLFNGSAVKQIQVYTGDSINPIYLEDTFELEYEESQCQQKGAYIKWVNSLGGISYWLFKLSAEDIAVKSLGEIENDFFNLNETLSPTEHIGVTASGTLDVFELFDESYIHILQDILISNKIYLYTGKQFTTSTFRDWEEIKIKGAKASKKDKLYRTSTVKITFELPDYNTKKL